MTKGLATSESCYVFLPIDNYPYWLALTGEGQSVYFTVPEDYCRMKGMTLCVVYLSTLENTVTECLISVPMVNYRKLARHNVTFGTWRQAGDFCDFSAWIGGQEDSCLSNKFVATLTLLLNANFDNSKHSVKLLKLAPQNCPGWNVVSTLPKTVLISLLLGPILYSWAASA
ncbi:hypothetical protein CR513_50324, partial [Mucuna pruriens]